MFQQNNTPAHSAKHTQGYIISEGIVKITWASNLLDLNHIEDAWSEFSFWLYDTEHQFDELEGLREVSNYEWEKLTTNN